MRRCLQQSGPESAVMAKFKEKVFGVLLSSVSPQMETFYMLPVISGSMVV